jgi:hypothetical protein
VAPQTRENIRWVRIGGRDVWSCGEAFLGVEYSCYRSQVRITASSTRFKVTRYSAAFRLSVDAKCFSPPWHHTLNANDPGCGGSCFGFRKWSDKWSNRNYRICKNQQSLTGRGLQLGYITDIRFSPHIARPRKISPLLVPARGFARNSL